MSTGLPFDVGRYKCLEFLGGGMAEVYKAWDGELERFVALKMLKREACLEVETRERFVREAKLSCRCVHDNIVVTYDTGEFEGRPFLVLEYLEGRPLSWLVKNSSLGGQDRIIEIAFQVASALGYVHSKGIIHRDVKPDNIYVDVRGRAKLIDFGIARTSDWGHTQSGVSVGSPHYMAPEQVAATNITTKVDIYAFGVVLFEMFTGARLVEGATMMELWAKILHATPDLAPLVRCGAPPEIVRLVGRCLEKDPDRRYADFDSICRELAPFASAPSSTGARPLTSAEQPAAASPRPGPRRRWALVAGLGALLAGGLALVYYALRPAVPLSAEPKQVSVKTATNEPARSLSLPSGDMVLVEAGDALIGQEKRRVSLPAFYIDKTEVSNRAYAEFCAGTGRRRPAGFRDDLPEHPAVNVTFQDAADFAAWAGKRLPAEPEWEKAARSSDGRVYPWGNDARPPAANMNATGTVPVSSFFDGASPCGALHLMGNVWEWVNGRHEPSPQIIVQFRDVPGLPARPTADEPWYAIRGGAYDLPASDKYLEEPGVFPARFGYSNIGFRCARDAAKP